MHAACVCPLGTVHHIYKRSAAKSCEKMFALETNIPYRARLLIEYNNYGIMTLVIITSAESWVYHYDHVTKQETFLWKHTQSSP